jgi:hypothetical protein
MEDQQRPSSDGLSRELVLSLAAPLLKGWPEPFDLTPSGAGLAERHGDFMQVAVALQDSGWIMYEALLVGAGPEPRAVNACMTAKGRVHLLELGGLGDGG